MLPLYGALTTIAAPAVRLHLRRRRERGREDPIRFGERLGVPGRPRPLGPLAWVHAASVGESLSVLGVIEGLRAHWACAVLVTTATRTSAELLPQRLPEGAIHQFAPVDLPAVVDRFLDFWRPDLALWVESELWPNLLTATRRRGIPTALLNARLSAASYRRWNWCRPAARTMLGGFRLCLAQSAADAARLRDLGALHVRFVGNLKNAAPPLPADPGEVARMRTVIAGRPVWLAASTHDPEEALAGRVHRRLARSHPGLLTIIVPRHPQRGDTIAAALSDAGLSVGRLSRSDTPRAETDIFLGDTIGELGLFYRLAPIAFVGRSLLAEGGQNPLEAALLGCSVLMGPHMANFVEIAAELVEAGAAMTVADEPGLAEAVDRLLRDPGERDRLESAARRVVARNAGALDAVMRELEPLLQTLTARHEGS